MSAMDPRLQAYLDGELDPAQLPEELRERAGRWDELLDRVARSGPAGAPMGLETRVMAAIAADVRRPSAFARWIEWAVRPRQIRISPLTALGVAAAVALLVARPWSVGSPGEPVAAGVAGPVYVQFVVEAEGAESVHLAGDFSDWQPTIALADPDGDGVWTGRIPLAPGVHEYMFVIDGSEWIQDPNAAGSRDDGFGRKNSLVAIAPVSGT